MIDLRGRTTTTWVLVALAIGAALLFDLETPPRRLVAMLYAIPILIAAHGLPRIAVGAIGVVVIALYLVSAWGSETPARLQMFSVVGLATVSYLSVGLALQIDRATEQARENEELAGLLSALLLSAPMGLVFWDRELNCALINASFASVLGVQPEQARGRPLRELVQGDAGGMEDDVRWVLRTKSPLADRELTSVFVGQEPGGPLLLPGEETRWIASYYPVPNAEGDIVGVGCVAVRVTERS